jgi:hypothetical protein
MATGAARVRECRSRFSARVRTHILMNEGSGARAVAARLGSIEAKNMS